MLLEYISGDSKYDEPLVKCPSCGGVARANWISVFKEQYEIQVEPFHCECGWTEDCPYECVGSRCISFDKCNNSVKKVSE